MLSRIRQAYCQEVSNSFRFGSVISSAGALLMLATILQRLSVLQSFTPSGSSVPLEQRFVKADDVQILIWDITGIKFQLLIALCLVVRALGQLSRKCVGALVGHVALALAIYEVLIWSAWDSSIRETYMPGLDFVNSWGDILIGLILLILVGSDLVLLLGTVIRVIKGQLRVAD